MSLMPPNYSKTVVSIGISDNEGMPSWVGTGFFACKNVSKYKAQPFLITNKHVIEGLNGIVIRMINKDSGEIDSFNISLMDDAQIFQHPNDKVDIVAIKLNGSIIESQNLEFNYFDIEKDAYSSNDLRASGFTEGNIIYMLGYPMGLVNLDSNQPICRMGCVARMDEEQIQRDFNVLLDVQNFPGNSGSPIISKPEIVAIEGTQHLDRAALIGIIHSYIPYCENLLNTQTKQIVEIRSENSGIAKMHPVELIREVIDLAFSETNPEEEKGLV